MEPNVKLSLSRNEAERLLQIVQLFGESSNLMSDKIFCYKVLRDLGLRIQRETRKIIITAPSRSESSLTGLSV